ncbi:MAG TPA: aminotransferase class I/II-fold pyridoxal phosphate-dependent enzyme [Pyrinomonadaceae bacterium]
MSHFIDGRAKSASLDVSGEELRELSARACEMAAAYFARIAELPVFPEAPAESLARLAGAELPVEGDTLARVLDECRAIFDASRHNGHPRMFGYVASPAAPVGAFANLLASALNQNVTAWRSAPAATVVERTTVRWLAEMIGYADAEKSCGGLLTSGGSAANLTALFVAHRAHAARNSTGAGDAADLSQKGLWNAGAPATIYVSDQVHLSIPKAADILGIGREQVRVVASDDNFRMDVRSLRESIERDARVGLRPFCVVASAGTVNTGAVDPLAEVAAVAREHQLWFHVDGAYGALARLDPTKRALFDGLAEADSVSLDAHKWLYAPLDCGCLILRYPERARAAFAGTEEQYIKVYEQQDDEAFAFWDYGLELSRPFRALKVWAMLRYYGVARIGAAIAEDCALAEYMAERVGMAEDFELLAPVTLGICCFRYVSADARRALDAATESAARASVNARLDDLNERVMQRVQRGGEAYLSNASLRGRFALRASITNFRTTRRDIDLTLDVVRRVARELNQGEGNN